MKPSREAQVRHTADSNIRLTATVIVIMVSIFLVGGEITARLVLKGRLHLVVPDDERNISYRYDRDLGWFPEPGSNRTLKGSRQFNAHHNSRGFRDREHGAKTQPRIAFLGDSYVWGYDVEREERFTEILAKRLPAQDIFNLGVSGYGTDQEFMLLQREFERISPDTVVLVFSSQNDRKDNSSNVRYGGYYKPYFSQQGDQLNMKGLPVPQYMNFFVARHRTLFKSWLMRGLLFLYDRLARPQAVTVADPTESLVGAMNTFVTTRGAKFKVAIQGEDRALSAFLREQKIEFVNLTTPHLYPEHGRHWTPKGQIDVANHIQELLEKATITHTR